MASAKNQLSFSDWQDAFDSLNGSFGKIRIARSEDELSQAFDLLKTSLPGLSNIRETVYSENKHGKDMTQFRTAVLFEASQSDRVVCLACFSLHRHAGECAGGETSYVELLAFATDPRCRK